jgi:hypothetical protein
MKDTATLPPSAHTDPRHRSQAGAECSESPESDGHRLTDSLARSEAACRAAASAADRLAREREELAELNQEAIACLQQALAERELATMALFSVVSGRRLWRFLAAFLLHPTAPITAIFLQQFPEVAEALQAEPP